jgi:hypothetical protein
MHVHTQQEKHTTFSAKTIWMPSSGSGGKEDEDTGERTKRNGMATVRMGIAITPPVVCSPLPRQPATGTVGEETPLEEYSAFPFFFREEE